MTLQNNNFPSLEFNRLAREKMKTKLLADILFDMQVCRLEGWDSMGYLNEIKDMIDKLMPNPKPDEE
jgi:hypothetical protein